MTTPITTPALRRALAGVPDVQGADDIAAAIADSVAFLASDAALRSLAADSYWPKWHSPWWHMLLLHELGEAQRIPRRVVSEMVDRLNALPLKIFPIRPEDVPPGVDVARDSSCHCALGCMAQVLTACGVDIDEALPWIKPWFVRYQMADGGLNCDAAAYLVDHECPSSMVATIAAFEAMLLGRWTAEQETFLERAADFLVQRRLMLGSSTTHNAEERDAQVGWLAPCFPRLYFYDVLRGLAALTTWSERSGRSIPLRAIASVIDHLVTAFPDGVIRIQREGAAICPTTWRKSDSGAWQRQPTSRFPLLDATCAVGKPSAALTRQWSATRRLLIERLDTGHIVD